MSLSASPISVEWTVPFKNTFFHLGIHNIPRRSARGTMHRLKAFTEQPNENELRGILADLDAEPGMLTVFNHPLWDETGINEDSHRAALLRFLSNYAEYVHGIELNGLRPWKENTSVIQLARDWSKPVISGGDRHTLEPNATLNLTSASDFGEFASEIRGGQSDVLMMRQYRTPHAARITRSVLDVVRTHENHGLGWTKWSDRVFYTLPEGRVESLAQIWGDRRPLPIEGLTREGV